MTASDTPSREDILAGLGEPYKADTAWSVVSGLLSERFSCRAFRSEPVPHQQLEKVFAAAQRSASWCNAQPWHITVTEGAATERFRSALLAYAKANTTLTEPDYPFPGSYEGVYKTRRRGAGFALYESLGIARGDRESAAQQMIENYRFFGAPHVLIITAEKELGIYGAVDCGIYLGNLLLLMHSAGIASIAQGALAKHAPFIRDYFSIPDNRNILCGVSFGFADPEHPVNKFRTTRAELSSVVDWRSE